MRKWIFGLAAVMWAGTVLSATPKKVVLDVENMKCPACSITIEKALERVPGVTDKRVDAKTATVTVTFDPDRTSTPVVARAITDAGFPAKVRGGG